MNFVQSKFKNCETKHPNKKRKEKNFPTIKYSFCVSLKAMEKIIFLYTTCNFMLFYYINKHKIINKYINENQIIYYSLNI